MKEKEIENYASKLLIDLTDKEMKNLTEEFKEISKQMDLINNIDNLEKVEPMHMVSFDDEIILREDKEEKCLDKLDVIKNSDDVLNDEVKVPKVVV